MFHTKIIFKRTSAWNKQQLKDTLKKDSKNYSTQKGSLFNRIRYKITSTPIGDQKYNWKYIYALRHTEYHLSYIVNEKKEIDFHFSLNEIYHGLLAVIWNRRLKKLSYKTMFQIPPFTFDAGLTIWHFGPIIVNEDSRIGKNCTIYPGVVIGQKNGKSPVVGNNVFIGAGSKIFGDCKIGDNVIIAQNIVVVNDIDDNSTLVSAKPRIL